MVNRRPYQSLTSIARGRTRGVSTATGGGTHSVSAVSIDSFASEPPIRTLTTRGNALASSMYNPVWMGRAVGPSTRDEYVAFPVPQRG